MKTFAVITLLITALSLSGCCACDDKTHHHIGEQSGIVFENTGEHFGANVVSNLFNKNNFPVIVRQKIAGQKPTSFTLMPGEAKRGVELHHRKTQILDQSGTTVLYEIERDE